MIGLPCRASSISLALLLLAAGTALAHALHARWEVAGDQLVVHAFFDGGDRAGDAKVRLQTEDGAEFRQGRTDAKGMWSTPKPPDGVYRLIVDAEDGHLCKYTLRLGQTGEADTSQGGDDPTDAERFPWLQLLIGVAAIAGFAFAFWFARRRIRPQINTDKHG